MLQTRMWLQPHQTSKLWLQLPAQIYTRSCHNWRMNSWILQWRTNTQPNVARTCNPSEAAVRHVAGRSPQIVFVNQLQLVLVTVLYIPSSACMCKDQKSLFSVLF